MKTLMRLCATTVCALIMSATGFAQHYTQTNLVSNTAGVAPVTDPQLINPWGLSRNSGSPWWVSDQATGFSTLYKGEGVGAVSGEVFRPERAALSREAA